MKIDDIDYFSIVSELSKYADFGEIYHEKVKIHIIELENGKIEKCFNILDKGFSIRSFKNGNINFSATNFKSPDELLKQHIKYLEKDTPKNNAIREIEQHKITPAPSFLFQEKLKLIQSMYEELKRTLPNITNSKLTIQFYEKEFQVHNNLGISIKSYVYGERFSALVACLINNEKFTVFESTGRAYDNLKDDEYVLLITKIITRMQSMNVAKPCPAGSMPCLLSAEAGGTLIHEAVGHGLEADLIDKGISIYKDRLGEKVASPLITVVDDGTYKDGWGTFYHDDEGTKAQKTYLIENGILKNYLYDLFYALKHNKQSTGNGRRQSYAHRPFPRMTNTMILPGKDDPKSILKGINRGILVKKMGGGQINTLTGDFIFEVQEGYLIENGEIIHSLKQASIIGNGPKVLNEIEAVCNDFGTSLGTCGKEGQGVPVGDGQPTIFIPNITIGGTAF
jgi:TldD protein